jgi:hypothetical protein
MTMGSTLSTVVAQHSPLILIDALLGPATAHLPQRMGGSYKTLQRLRLQDSPAHRHGSARAWPKPRPQAPETLLAVSPAGQTPAFEGLCSSWDL